MDERREVNAAEPLQASVPAEGGEAEGKGVGEVLFGQAQGGRHGQSLGPKRKPKQAAALNSMVRFGQAQGGRHGQALGPMRNPKQAATLRGMELFRQAQGGQ